jgi:hypothetical protein
VDLLLYCTTAFIAVFALLAVLAVVMKVITQVFPERLPGKDIAMVAAVASVVSTLYPGAVITNVEEVK